MALTQEKFDAWVRRLEGFAQRQPRHYRLRVGLLAALGYGYILLVLVGLMGLIGLLGWLVVATGRLNFLVVKGGVLLAIPVWVIMRSLFVSIPPPDGIPLSRQQVPQLFVLVDELTKKLQAQPFHRVLLIPEFNAAVSQVPRLGMLGWHMNYLLVGLPLMQALSPEQFRAVLAHELGHLSGNHSRFGGWIYRVQKTWMQILARLDVSAQDGSSMRQGSSVLFNRFLAWYAPFFSAYSFVLRRMNEYEADRCALRLAGDRAAAEALIQVAVKAQFLQQSYWPSVYDQVSQQGDPPLAFAPLMTVLQAELAPRDVQQSLEQALAEKTGTSDTHPCLTDRLTALGYEAELEKLPVLVSVPISAAERFLAGALGELMEQCDRQWQADVSNSWRQRYAYLQSTQTALQALETKAKTARLSDDEAWEHANLIRELRGDAVAMPLLIELIERCPDHGSAHYALGEILLEQDDLAGVAHLETAIAHRPEWALNGCQRIYSFFEQRGQSAAAQPYGQRAEQEYNRHLQAKHERSQVSENDTFQGHGLAPDQVEALLHQLAQHQDIKAAYFVQKVVTYFPMQPLCVLALDRRPHWLEVSRDRGDRTLLDQLGQELALPYASCIIFLHHSNAKLRKKLRSEDGALIYRR